MGPLFPIIPSTRTLQGGVLKLNVHMDLAHFEELRSSAANFINQ